MKQWKNFKEGKWTTEINVQDFIQQNYTPYTGDDKFLEKTTKKTNIIWETCQKLLKKELKKHVLNIDTKHMSGINGWSSNRCAIKKNSKSIWWY